MTQVYVPLLDEGTDVWRPSSAEHIRGDVYRIMGEVPAEEQWQFSPGQLVSLSSPEAFRRRLSCGL
jgi:hypothetical protein